MSANPLPRDAGSLVRVYCLGCARIVEAFVEISCGDPWLVCPNYTVVLGEPGGPRSDCFHEKVADVEADPHQFGLDERTQDQLFNG
jgi:hypothetical protein